MYHVCVSCARTQASFISASGLRRACVCGRERVCERLAHLPTSSEMLRFVLLSHGRCPLRSSSWTVLISFKCFIRILVHETKHEIVYTPQKTYVNSDRLHVIYIINVYVNVIKMKHINHYDVFLFTIKG